MQPSQVATIGFAALQALASSFFPVAVALVLLVVGSFFLLDFVFRLAGRVFSSRSSAVWDGSGEQFGGDGQGEEDD